MALWYDCFYTFVIAPKIKQPLTSQKSQALLEYPIALEYNCLTP